MLITTCPECKTSFKVTLDQLALYQGKVQCGSCRGLFVAFDHLVSVDEESESSPGTTPTIQPLSANEVESIARLNTAREEKTYRTKEPQPVLELHIPADLLGQPAIPTNRKKIGLLVSSALLLSGLLCAQTLYYWRSEWMSLLPTSRPYFIEMCRHLHCQVDWPEQIELLAITGSDFRLVPTNDSAETMRADLIFQIRNRSPRQIAYPRLELSLLDNQQTVVGRRIIEVTNYLPRERKAELGFAPHQELSATLRLDLTGLNVSGYQLYLR